MMKHVGEKEPHYGLRKLSIGVASVLLGMTMYGVVGHADSGNSRENVSVDQNVSEGNVNGNDQLVLQSKDQNVQGGGSNPASTQNIEGREDTGNENNVNTSHGTLNTSNVMNASQVASTFLASEQSTPLNHAQNVSGSFQTLNNGDNRFTCKMNDSFPVNNVSWDFDITSNQFQLGKPVFIGSIYETFYNGESHHSLSYAISHGALPIEKDGVNYGTVEAHVINDGDPGIALGFYFHPNTHINVSGVQHLSYFVDRACIIDWLVEPITFTGYTDYVDSKLQIRDSDGKVLKSNNIRLVRPYVSRILSGPYQYTSGANSWFDDANDIRLSTRTGYNPADKNGLINFAMRVVSDPNNPFVSFKPVIAFEKDAGIRSYNSEDRSMSESIQAIDHLNNEQALAVADGLSVDQLQAMDFSGIRYSRQNNGDFIIVAKIKNTDVEQGISSFWNQDFNNWKSFSWALAQDKNQNQAIQNTIKHYKNDFSELEFWFTGQVADPTRKATVTQKILSGNSFHDSGAIFKQSKVAISTPVYTSVNGQSTVKLHLINSTNGAELSQVQSFTDWPNRGKKANLQISVPAGYQLVTANTSDTLKRLNLTGTAITSNTQVDYPKENTISDYYVLLAPKMENATINIVDKNENNKVLYSGQVSGAFNSVIAGNDDVNSQLKKLLDSGLYDLDHNGLSDGGLYKDGTNTVTISLKHHIDSTERHYRVIEDLPDGTEKVIVDLQATLYKDADSKFWYQDGAYLDGILQGTLLKPNHYVLTAGIRNQGDPTWLTTPVDRISGYSASMTGNMHGVYTDEVLVSFNDQKYLLYFDLISGGDAAERVLQSGDYHIIYTKNNYPVTISYYDATGKQVSSSTTTHAYQDIVTASNIVPAGYVLLSGQNNQLTVGVDHNELDLLVAPTIQRSQEIKRVTRTIVYDDPKIQPVVQVVILHRDKFTNIVNNSVSYGQWLADSASEFAEYVPVLKSGYVADPIAAEQVNGDSQDETVNVHYQAINGRKEYKYIDVNGVGYDNLPTGDQIVNGQDLNKNGVLIVKKSAPVINKIEYVKRIITVIMPNGRKRTIIQKTRKGGRFLKPHLPKLRGYNVDVNGSLDVMTANSDVNVMVRFVKM